MSGSESGHLLFGLTKARIEALTDGIFAFAMTLLVTTLDIPEPQGFLGTSGVARIIMENYPGFLHYVMAFLILAAFWVSHHMQFHALRVVDRRMIWMNILLLLFVALLPFSTDLAGDYPDIPLSSMVFETNIFLIGGMMFLQWLYATDGRRLVSPEVTDSRIAASRRRALVLPVVSLAGIILALLGFGASTLVYLLVPPLILLTEGWNPRDLDRT
ncbi:MAG: TMEM175 family protein [Methanomicrobiales archaeon]|nr:TMEM175 family protein [Methanomicrobiales archaeon]